MIRVFIFLMIFTTPAYAYLDSGTGSMIVQMLFAAIAGFLAMLKLYWQKVKQAWQALCNFLRGKKKPVTEQKNLEKPTDLSNKSHHDEKK